MTSPRMNLDRILMVFREYPALAGIGFFVLVSLVLAVFFGVLMIRSGASLRPLVFFFGFVLIIGGPQAVVHMLNAVLTARAKEAAAADSPAPSIAATEPSSAATLQPVPWSAIFGPDADPDLISDARHGLGPILGDAVEARLSFNTAGETALAARFASAQAAREAFGRYGAFFQFTEAPGGDTAGWTGRRYQGQGEWNHVVAVGNELYAWTGTTRDRVLARRTEALGAVPETSAAPDGAVATATREPAADWLRSRPALMAAFLTINLVIAVLWFFKASAWSAREAAQPGIRPVEATVLRAQLLEADHGDLPITVTAGPGPDTLEVNWRYADARWFDLMRVHQIRRTHRLILHLDPEMHRVRVREFWSSFDASAGPGSLNLDWKAARGMEFFHVQRTVVAGWQLGIGHPSDGEWFKTFTFDVRAMKQPLIGITTAQGWDWQPVMWDGPRALRWLTE